LKRLEKKTLDSDTNSVDSLCLNCTNVLKQTLKSHKCNLATKSYSDDENTSSTLFEESVKKRQKKDQSSQRSR